MVKKYKVSLFGEAYTLISDEPEEHITASVHHVDELMRSITQSLQVTDSKKAAVLAALQLASRLLELEHRYHQKQYEHEKLIDLIDRELPSSLM
jgi:cell division protein ZapA (FtsZ GTPase activity inhibitor)